MSELTVANEQRFRPRAQSLFEYRPRTNTELTISLLDRFISSRNLNTSAIEIGSTNECEVVIRTGSKRRIFFIIQPIIASLIVFPLLILFWQAGWNFIVEWLESTTIGKHWSTLVGLYFLAQTIFLLIYLNQDHLYDHLHRQKNQFYVTFLLQFHTFITSVTYIVQWVSMWTIWDRYTSDDLLLMLSVSISALLAFIALIGHPCDLVCAPFILSYDSVEYNIRIGSPFSTEKISDCLAHFLNYIFYEYILSLLSILTWRGTYQLLDVHLFPKNDPLSASVCLLIGYPIYFFLMYTQAYSDKFCPLPTFIYLNYPTFLNNIRHIIAFFTCVLLWRGFWIFFDTYIATMSLAVKFPYLFYIICMSIAFVLLSLLKTASSINGPMSHMFDQYDLFPHYPNSYLVKWFDQMKNSDEISSDSTKRATVDPCTLSFLE